MKDEQLFTKLMASMREEFPGIRFCHRSEVWLTRMMDRLWLKKSKSSFTTTVFSYVVTPDDFEFWPAESKYEVMRHEREHLRQYKRWGFGILWLGCVLMGILYLLVLPTGLTMRAYFEKQAYLQSAVAKIQLGYDADVNRRHFIARMQQTFTGFEYVWMAVSKKRTGAWAKKAWEQARDIAWALNGEVG